MMGFEKPGLVKEIHFYDPKDEDKELWFRSSFFLNPTSLSPEKRQEVLELTGLSHSEAVEIFEYRKNNDGYWDGAKLHQQVVNKALPIAKVLFPGYSLYFSLTMPPFGITS